MNKEQYLDALEADSEALLSAAAAVSLGEAVSHCGDWAMRDLLGHQAFVWGFAAANVAAAGEKTPPATEKPEDDSRMFEWAASVRATMLEALRAADPAAPAWTFAANNQTAGFWQRRMMAETVVHLWDAETCAGTPTLIAPEIASESIDEYTEVGLRFSSGRPNRIYPANSIHIHCTDTKGEWIIVGNGESDFTVAREHTKGDAAVKGPAANLLLWLWGRDGGDVEILGDETVATTWRELAP